MGWSGSAEEFNFARDYGDYWRKESKNPGNMQIRRNMTLSCLRNELGRITPAVMMKTSRSHLEGTVAEPRWAPSEPFWPTPCLHDTAANGYHSAASMVAQLRPEKPALLRQVYWSGFSNPCTGVYKPFYLHGPLVPAGYAKGSSTYAADSPWWWANRIKLLCDLNYRALAPSVRGVFDLTEAWEMDRQNAIEAEAQRLIELGREADAVRVLQRFIDGNCSRIDREYQMLNQTLPTALKTVGTRNLFLDYLKQWTANSGVPLPLR